jgi:CrcB protein
MHELTLTIGWVALGSACGGMTRFFVSGWVARRVGETFPWGTMVVNVSGACVLGALAAWAPRELPADWTPVWSLLAVGFLGSYTTVSSFSIQTLALLHDGEMARAWSNVLLTLLLCLAGVSAGLLLAGALLNGAAGR